MVEKGELFIGKMRIASKSFNCAFVKPAGFTRDVFLETAVNRNRTLDGDVVVVRIKPEEEWKDMAKTDDDVSSLLDDMSSMNVTEKSSDPLWDCQFDAEDEKTADETDGDDEDTDTTQSVGQIEATRLEVLAKAKNKQLTAEVVGVKEYGTTWTREHMGRIEYRRKSDAYAKFFPHDVRVPRMIVPSLHLPDPLREDPQGDAANELYLVKIDFDWRADSMQPHVQGGSVRSLGESGCIGPETKALLVTYGVDHGEFPDDVIEDLQVFIPKKDEKSTVSTKTTGGDNDDDDDVSLGVHETDTTWSIPEEEIKRRRDLRQHRIFSIDPTTAKDLDDALHIKKIDKDTYEIGVHIADVSYFVRKGTALDREAGTRCTSVYLVQRVIPMLPPLLCEQLCSLNPGVERLAFSVIWKMKADGSMVAGDRPWYGRTVIKSCCKLDYGTAQKMLDGTIKESDVDIDAEKWALDRRPSDGHSIADVVRDVKALGLVALGRRARRFQSGALSLNKCKLSFKLDPKTGNPKSMFAYPIRQSNNLVEEYMLLANFLVAQRLLQAYGKDGPALLRNHPRPAAKPLEELREICAKHGIMLDTGSAKSLQASLKALKKRTESGARGLGPIDYDAVIGLLTHPMMQAQYIAAGGCEEGAIAWRHYALAIPYYTHFTSPIRRYADVIVHRLLASALSQPRAQSKKANVLACGYDVDAVAETCGRCNEKKEASKQAQMRSDVVYLCVYIRELGKPIEAEGVIVGVGKSSMNVLIPSLGLEHQVPVNDAIPNTVSVDFKEKEQELIVTVKGGKRIHISAMTKCKCVIDAKLSPPPCDVVLRVKITE